MKYLVIARPRGNLPPATAPNILRGTKTWVNDRIKDRTLDQFYGFLQGGGVGVANANTHDDLMKLLRSNPVWPFTETEIHPLVDFNSSIDSATELFQKMAA